MKAAKEKEMLYGSIYIRFPEEKKQLYKETKSRLMVLYGWYEISFQGDGTVTKLDEWWG